MNLRLTRKHEKPRTRTIADAGIELRPSITVFSKLRGSMALGSPKSLPLEGEVRPEGPGVGVRAVTCDGLTDRHPHPG
jgi:hypothetical protein